MIPTEPTDQHSDQLLVLPDPGPALPGIALVGSAPPLPGAGGGGGQPAPGNGNGGGGGGRSGGFPPEMFIIVLVLGFVMILMSMAQRKERKKRDAMLKAIKKHDRVQTVGGVLGSIVEVKSDEVVLKVDESSNTRITFARSAIQQILSSGKNGAAA